MYSKAQQLGKQKQPRPDSKRAYAAVTDRATTKYGYAKCEGCGRTDLPLQRHHIVFRSQGGKDTEENLICLCLVCHGARHGTRVRL